MYLYVVVYDIPCDKRRQKVFNLLSGYGTWVQYSVFECVLSQRQFEELRTRLRGRVNLDEDNIRFYHLSARAIGQVETWGSGPPVTQPPTSVIV
ncbi:MAG: CRISPR-associated endonuclease Cas2 [Oscillatoriaceae cyanobacterium Prado104]|jgi:CRISPR-associated protein Cas2|nr:CRISPR-associated endonuclease Cas2 [Oscillatoriaceae cyanobacterium Prado104]